MLAAFTTAVFAAYGFALAMRRSSAVAGCCLLVGTFAFGVCRAGFSERDWSATLASLGTLDVGVDSPRRLVCVEGVVVSTPRTDELAVREDLLKCGALEEDTLARFVPRTPCTRFNLAAQAMFDGNGARTEVSATLRVVVEGTDAGCSAGDTVLVKGWLAGFGPPNNPGGFNAQSWSRMRSIAGLLMIPGSDLIERLPSRGFSPTSTLARWRSFVDRSLHKALADEPALDATALIAASTTGANWPGLRSASKTFAATGVQHLVAISGFNFAILAACAIWCTRMLRFGPRLGAVTLVLLATLFVSSIESEVSSVRAALMGGAAAAALSFGRSIRFGSLIAIAVIVLVVCDPLCACDPGFQLSFGAIFGLRFFAPRLSRALALLIDGYGTTSVLARRISEPAASAIAAWTATLPIVAYHFGVCQLWCVPCTLVLSPNFALMVISSNFAVTAQPMCAPVGTAAGWVALVNAKLVLMVVRFCSRLPGATELSTATRLLVDREVPAGSWHARIDMIDVGNGSCYLFRSGTSSVVFDCGSLGAAAAGSQTIVPALCALGVRKLDAVVISHPNIDHYGALPEVVRAFAVDRVLITPQFFAWSQKFGAASEALRAARSAGADIELFARGGEHQFGAMLWRVIHPPAEETFADSNDGSLVIRVSVGDFVALVAGDAAREACRSLLASPDPSLLGGVTVFELPHHGSFQPWSAALAERVQSEIVLQSTGPARLANDRWGDIFDSKIRLVTARDRACSVVWKSDDSIWVGRWDGWKYVWVDTTLRLASAPRDTPDPPLVRALGGDENRTPQDDRIPDRSTATLLDLDFERSLLNRCCDLSYWRLGVEWKPSKFLVALSNDNRAITPRAKREWNLCLRAQHGEALGDFVDEPFRPPDFYCGCAEGSLIDRHSWLRILRSDKRWHCWQSDLRLQLRQRKYSLWFHRDTHDLINEKR